jgi:hypothetical protein
MINMKYMGRKRKYFVLSIPARWKWEKPRKTQDIKSQTKISTRDVLNTNSNSGSVAFKETFRFESGILLFLEESFTYLRFHVGFEVRAEVRITMLLLWVLTSYWSPEDGDGMSLRDVGIYLRVYTASKPRRTTSSSALLSLTWNISHLGFIDISIRKAIPIIVHVF